MLARGAAPPRAGVHRPRSRRLEMLGSGYRAVIDGQCVALVNLSLTGAQVRGPHKVTRDQPAILRIGWPQDQRSCDAIARVRWVQVEGDRSNVPAYRIGLTFETWDVRRLKEIMHHWRRTFDSHARPVDPW